MAEKHLEKTVEKAVEVMQRILTLSSDLDKITKLIKDRMMAEFGNTWHVVASVNVKSLLCRPSNKTPYLDVVVNRKIRIVLFQDNGSELDMRMDMIRLCKKVLMIITLSVVTVFGYTTHFCSIECSKFSEKCTDLQIEESKSCITWQYYSYLAVVMCMGAIVALKMIQLLLNRKG